MREDIYKLETFFPIEFQWGKMQRRGESIPKSQAIKKGSDLFLMGISLCNIQPIWERVVNQSFDTTCFGGVSTPKSRAINMRKVSIQLGLRCLPADMGFMHVHQNPSTLKAGTMQSQWFTLLEATVIYDLIYLKQTAWPFYLLFYIYGHLSVYIFLILLYKILEVHNWFISFVHSLKKSIHSLFPN